ncbi:hypothetical protein [Rosistilla oblonga]|uniref:hypothetical protein n=1 Tax=Rosistilla oblonga TaxID=2527990 RepID=UPI003A97E638
MSSTSNPPTVHRPRPSSRPTGGGLPTLFRIPNLNDRPQTSEPVDAAPLAAPSTDFAETPPPAPPVSEPAPAPEPVYQRIDASHTYGDLPELPPISEPADGTWMETVGSRLVLILLFLAVATVAIIATRDVPPESRAQYLADDSESLRSSDPVHVADATALPTEPADSDHASIGLPSDPALPPEIHVVSPTIEPLAPPETNFEAEGETHLSSDQEAAETPDAEATHDHARDHAHDLPSLGEIEDEPETELPAFPIPNLALTGPQASAPADDTTVESPQSGDSEAQAATEPTTDEPRVASRPAIDTPSDTTADSTPSQSYQATSTPNTIADWRQFIPSDAGADNPTNIAMAQPTEGQTAAPGNQFNYPTDPVSPSPLNPPQYPPYMGEPAAAANQPPYAPQQAFDPQQQAAQQQTFAAHQQQMAQQRLMAAQQQFAQQQQQQMAAQQQQAQSQQPTQTYVPGQGYVGQSLPQAPYQPQQQSGYAPNYAAPQNNYGQPAGAGYPMQSPAAAGGYANPNQPPYAGQQPYVPSR